MGAAGGIVPGWLETFPCYTGHRSEERGRGTGFWGEDCGGGVRRKALGRGGTQKGCSAGAPKGRPRR